MTLIASGVCGRHGDGEMSGLNDRHVIFVKFSLHGSTQSNETRFANCDFANIEKFFVCAHELE